MPIGGQQDRERPPPQRRPPAPGTRIDEVAGVRVQAQRELACQLAAARPPVVRIGCERRHQHAPQGGGAVGREPGPGSGRPRVAGLASTSPGDGCDAARGGVLERAGPGQQLPQHHARARRCRCGCRGRRRARGRFRVTPRPAARATCRRRTRRRSRPAGRVDAVAGADVEVGELRDALDAQQHVRRLDVAVQHAVGARVLERVGQPQPDPRHGLRPRQRRDLGAHARLARPDLPLAREDLVDRIEQELTAPLARAGSRGPA